MARKQKTPTDAEIHNSVKAQGEEVEIIFNDAEAEAKDKRLRALIENATEKQKLRLIADSTEAAISTDAFNYAPYMGKEEFNRLYYRAIAAVYIREDYNLLRILDFRLGEFFNRIFIFMGDFQTAAFYVAAVKAFYRALEAAKGDTGKDLPAEAKEALISDITRFSHAYAGYVDSTDSDKGIYRVEVKEGIKQLTDLAADFKVLKRDIKTRVSAISDTIEVLDIADIIDKPTKDLLAKLVENTDRVEFRFKRYISGIRQLSEITGGAYSLDAEALRELDALEAAIIPYQRTHAYTDKYRKYVAEYFQGKPGDNGLGDKILKEVAKYKRNKN